MSGNHTPEEQHPELAAYRRSIDNIDAALVYLLAERFKVTKKVGYYKREHDLPAGDPAREQRQIARLHQLAHDAELDVGFTEKFLQFITREVILRHEQIREGEAI